MVRTQLFLLGTPVIDYYAKYNKTLKDYKIKVGCTNYFPIKIIEKILKKIKIISINAGDNAKNVAIAYKLACAKSCAYTGILGKDKEAKIFKKSLKKYKIKDLTIQKDGRTGKIICLIDKNKQRTFIANLGVGIKRLRLKNFIKSKIFFCTNITFINKEIGLDAKKIIKRLKKEGTKIAISLESPNLIKKNLSKTLEFCSYADYIFLNEQEMRAFGTKQKELKKLKALIFLKMGKKGSRLIKDGKIILEQKAKRIKKVKDTTGAGDFFAGGALAGLAKGYDLKKTLRIANNLAVKVITRVGVEP
ncbi:MAG: PfkB family carbohydrate kinase [Candidatus Omnitrophica bacterium]|nr:PfkB family carbohydrate kinase [Candidatus Omnitrophota bacterium]